MSTSETVRQVVAQSVEFTVFCHPEPQGSARAFVRNGKAAITSTNKNLKPYRQAVTMTALDWMNRNGVLHPMAGKHEPIGLILDFFFNKPPSVPKKRTQVVVKPDLDKLIRATLDALTGVLYVDDAQVVSVIATKHYGEVEKVDISATVI